MKLWNTLWKRRETITKEFENTELAEFLEDTVHAIVDMEPDAIAVVARSETDQAVFTNCYNCNTEYKAILAFHLLCDIITDVVKTNKDFIFEENDEIDGDDDEIDE